MQVNIQIMRTFVQLRHIVSEHKELAQRLYELEKQCDYKFKVVFDALSELSAQPEVESRSIGFIWGED